MRCILTFLLIFFTVNLNAQTDTARISFGASCLPLYFNNEEEGLKLSGLALKGSFGIFISNSFSVENNVFYYKNNDVNADGGNLQSESYGLQLSLRYHLKIKEKISLFADVGAGFGSIKYYDDYQSEYFSYDYYNSGIVLYTAGIGAFIKVYKNLDFEIFIPYLEVHNTTNKNNIYGNDRGSMLYGALAGPNLGLRLSF